MNKASVVLLLVANLPTYLLVGWVVFGTWSNFLEILWFLLRGHDFRSYEEEREMGPDAFLKTAAFVLMSGSVMVAEYHVYCWLLRR
jgi:hypothetical protein